MTNDSDTAGIPEAIEPSGYLSWEMVDEANVFDDSEPDDSREYDDEDFCGGVL